MPSTTQICVQCQREFRADPSDRRKACSVSCARESLRAPHKAAYEKNPRCCPCGEPIPYEKRHAVKFCAAPKKCRVTFSSKPALIPRRKPIRADQIEQAKRMFEVNGYGLEQIADALNCSPNSVKGVLQLSERGQNIRTPAQEWEKETARTRRATGETVPSIARSLKRSPATVEYWVRDIVVLAKDRTPAARRLRERTLEVATRVQEHEERDRLDAAKAVELYQGELSLGRTALEVGRSYEWVRTHLLAAGVTLRR